MSTFARREAEFRPSPVRAVFEMAMSPEYASLAGGNPDTSLLPHERIADLAAGLLRDRGTEILQYGSGAGITALPATISTLMDRVGAAGVDERNVLITTGSQMGIDLITKLYCNQGDVVIAEGPTYVGALGVFGSYEVDLRQVPTDDDGVDPEGVAEAIDAARAQGRRVGYVYVIPHHQNPSGVTLSQERRRRLVDVCASRDVVIAEDDPYAFVGFPGVDPLPSLYSMNPDGVIYLGSFSKLFAPGLRVGWMAAPEPVRARLQIAAEAVSIHPAVLAQELANAYVSGPDWEPTLDRLRELYHSRCQTLLSALASELPLGVRWTKPSGGFFTWLTLPGLPADTDLLAVAIEHRLVLVPGDACWVHPPATRYVRLAYSNGSPEQLHEGARRLGVMLRSLGMG